MADTRVCNLDSDLVGLGRRYLDVFIAELLAGAPGDGRLAGDGLQIRVSQGRYRGCDGPVRDALRGCVGVVSLTFPAVDAIVVRVQGMN